MEPFLYIGITFAILFISGKIPSSKDELQISLKVGEISFLISLSKFIGTEDGPVDFESSRVLMISHISSDVVGAKNSG